MATDLTPEFEAGRIAYLEGVSSDACPYFATSDCADAWHAGRTFEVRRPTDFMLGKVTKGRGYLVNVAASPAMKGRHAKLVFLVAYPAQGAPYATLQTEF